MHNRMSLQDEPQYKRQCLYLNALIHCPRSRSHRARRLCCEELEHELDRSRAKPIASVHLFDAEAELIAVASARIVDDDDQLLHDTAYIMTLGIKEMHRRYGLGTRAIQLMLELLATQTSCSMAT